MDKVKQREKTKAAELLRKLIQRVENLEQERSGVAEDIREVYSEAKAYGFDPKTMRRVVMLRRQDRQARQEEQDLVDTYMAALGL